MRSASKTASSRKAKRWDRLARWIITLGGVAVIASVAAILAMIAGVTLPLFRKARAEAVYTCRLPDTIPVKNVLGLGIEMDVGGRETTALVWTAGGTLALVDPQDGKMRGEERLPSSTAQGGQSHFRGDDNGSQGDIPRAAKIGTVLRRLLHVEPLEAGRYSLLWSDGSASLVEIVPRPAAAGTTAQGPQYAVRTLASVPCGAGVSPAHAAGIGAGGTPAPQMPMQALVRRSDAGTVTRVALLPSKQISILRETTAENLAGDEETTTHAAVLRDPLAGEIRVMTMDRDGGTLYAGTSDGRLVRWRLDPQGEVAGREVVRAFADRRAVTALALLLGDVSLAVGDARGGLTTWFTVNADATRKLRLIHRLSEQQGEVRAIRPSGRNKMLASLGGDGAVHLDYATSERHMLSIAPEERHPLCQFALGRRGNVLAGLDAGGTLRVWRIHGGYPEISWNTLFGKVFYEGYESPEYAWQTTGGEDFEPKFSLVPLVFGTLKGTFYAMLFAGPLALFGAAYVSYFTTPGMRRMIKPLIEVMATVPSVVIGFLIALWLAPILERWVLAFFVSLVTVPAVFAGFMVLWQIVRRLDWAKRVENGYEFLVLLPVLAAGVAVAVGVAGPLEAWLFHGNFRQWLFAGPLGMRYDQRNNIIIAFGLGFTVIPIIFSIAEDSLSNVPYNMTAASMAMGASRWQTLWRVVLPSASPGIFAAMMIGFGRAVGETMIVLMATGNTPILDWSPLNGMRTLSANIAVEIPEAPVGGTLYRVLFLCAVLLFVLTFTVNTAAELVRQRLRKRFGRF